MLLKNEKAYRRGFEAPVCSAAFNSGTEVPAYQKRGFRTL